MPTFEPLETIRQYRLGTIDVEQDTLRMALFNYSVDYVPNDETHNNVSDVLDGGVTAQEIDRPSYSRQSVTGANVSVDTVDGEVVFDTDDTTFTNLDGGDIIQGWLMYKQVGADDTTPGDDPIISIEDEVKNANGNNVTTNAANITIQMSAEGIINENVTTV